MEPSNKFITSEDLKLLNLISKIIKLQNPQPLSTCREDLLINGYMPDIDAEQSSLFEAEHLSDESDDYFQEIIASGSLFSLHQPLELLVNTVTNSFLSNMKVRSCSGRASTSSVRSSNSGRTSSLGTAPIRAKPPTAGSVAGRTSLSTEEKQAKRSGVGFFHRTNDRFYSRNGGFESSSGSDDTSSSTAGDETDDEGLLQRNRQNRPQSTKKMQPITYLSRAPQGRRNTTVRNGSLPNRPTQKEITSRTSANLINKPQTKSSTSINQAIAPTTKPRSTSTSTINAQKRTPIINSVKAATTAMRSSSTNPGASKTSGRMSVQKAHNAEKATQREQLSKKNVNENVQQAGEKGKATFGTTTTLDQNISTTPYGRREMQNYTTAERTNECQEALTLAKKAGGKEKTQSCFSDTNKKEQHSLRNQNKEKEPLVQPNKMNESNALIPTTTATTSTMTAPENLNSFGNLTSDNNAAYYSNVFPSSTSIRPPTADEEERQFFEDAAEVLKQHAYPSERQHTPPQEAVAMDSNQNQADPNMSYNLNQTNHFATNPTSFHPQNVVEQHQPTYLQQNAHQQQRPNSQLYMQQTPPQGLQQPQYPSPPQQHLSQPNSHDNTGYLQHFQQQSQTPGHQQLQYTSPPQRHLSQPNSHDNTGYHQHLQQQSQTPIQQHQQLQYTSPPQQHLSQPSSLDNRGYHQHVQQQSQNPRIQHPQQSHYQSPAQQHLKQPICQEDSAYSHQLQQPTHTHGFQQPIVAYKSPPQLISQPTSQDNRGYHPKQLLIGTSPSFQQQISPPQQRFQPAQMFQQTTYSSISNSMPAAVPLPSPHSTSNHQYNTFRSNIPQRPQLSQNWTNASPSEFYAPAIPVPPSELLQPHQNVNAAAYRSPQMYDQQSPQQRPSQRRSNPSTTIHHHLQQPQSLHFSSPTEPQNFINSPATPMSNPRPSPLPPPYSQNNGQPNFANGVVQSSNLVNVNSTTAQEHRNQQQRAWERQQQQQQQQQQFMAQQHPWQQQSQQFISPQHPQFDQVTSGPGMYSIPPNCYGYPSPTLIPPMPETPTKAAKTPRKKKSPPKESTLNRLLSTPARVPLMQQPQVQPIRPPMFQQQRQINPQQIYSQPALLNLQHQRFAIANPQMNQQQQQQQQQVQSNNLQQQYYMIPASHQANMQMPSQRFVAPPQSLPPSLQPPKQQQQQQYGHSGSFQPHVQFQQLSMSPQHLQQPISQTQQIGPFITSPQQQQQQQSFPLFNSQQSQQRTSQLHLQQPNTQHQNLQDQQQQQNSQQPYLNSSSEPPPNNNGTPQINSPYSNGSIPLTPNFTNSMAPNFYPTNSRNVSPGNSEFSPTNPKLHSRLSNFNTTLICNPNGALSPFTSPGMNALVTPSPPKTPQLKRPFEPQMNNNDDNGDILKKKKESLISQSPFYPPVVTCAPEAFSTPPATSSFQATSSIYVSSSSSKQNNPPTTIYNEYSSPFPAADKYYKSLNETRAKESAPVATQSLAPDNLNMTEQSNPSNTSEITVNVEKAIPPNIEQSVCPEQDIIELDEVDPCDEFLDLDAVYETTDSSSMPTENPHLLESGEIVDAGIESNYVADVAVQNNSQREESAEETNNSNVVNSDIMSTEEPEVEKQKEVETLIHVNNNDDELEEGEIVESDEEVQAIVYTANSKIDNKKEKVGKRSREFEIDEPPIIEEKRPKISTDSYTVVPTDIPKNELQQEPENSNEELLLTPQPSENNATSAQNDTEINEAGQRLEEVCDEELLLADSPIKNTAEGNIQDLDETTVHVDINAKETTSPTSEGITANDEELLLADSPFKDAVATQIDKDNRDLKDDDDNFEESQIPVATDEELLLDSPEPSGSDTNPPQNIDETNVESQKLESDKIESDELLLTNSPLKDVIPKYNDDEIQDLNETEAMLNANAEENISVPTLSHPEANDEESLLADSPKLRTSSESLTNNEAALSVQSNIDANESNMVSEVENDKFISEESSLLADSPLKNTDCESNHVESSVNDNLGFNAPSSSTKSLNVETNDEELLNSPELINPSVTPATNIIVEPEESIECNVESKIDSEVENTNIIDEASLLNVTLTKENPNHITEVTNQQNEEVIDETNHAETSDLMEVDVSHNTAANNGEEDGDTAPSYEELMENCGEQINIQNQKEVLSTFGAHAAMNAATKICTLNVMRNEVHQVISDISSASSIEQSLMISIVQDTVDLQLAAAKDKQLTLVNASDQKSQKYISQNIAKEEKNFEGTLCEVLMPLYTAAIQWEKEENKNPEFYHNIKYVKKLLLSMVANFGSNDTTNIWYELFTLQIFSTPQRLNIFYNLLKKSINVCDFLNDFISLVNDLFNITQLAACLFIKDYKDLKKIDSNLASVIIKAVKRVRGLTPELRSKIIFKFQIRIHEFLQKFENSNVSPEAHSFVSSLSWDVKTLCDSRDLPSGHLPLHKQMDQTVCKIFKQSMKTLEKSGGIEIKGWTYNLTKSVLQSRFMSKIIRSIDDSDKNVQESHLKEIIPNLLKLVLTVPHLFVAGDPYHQLELVPSIFEDSAPILKKAAEDIHEQVVVPFLPFATIMESIKKNNSRSTDSLLRSCQRLYKTLKNAQYHIPEAIEAERRRCSNKLLYEKIHREYVRRQMGKSDLQKFKRDDERLDLKNIHLIVNKLFTTKTLEVPPRIIAAVKDGDKEAVSTEKIFRAKMISESCDVLKEVLDSLTIEQKLEFMIDHPLLNEKLKVADILNVHQFGTNSLGCFTAFIGLLSLPNNKVLGDPKSSTFFQSIKERRNIIYYFAIKNSALIKNNRPPLPTQILQKDIPIYDILVQIFVTADMKRILCCPDNVSSYLYLALIINDISNIDIKVVSESLFAACGINEKEVEFFATSNFANDLEFKIDILMNKELDDIVKDILSRVNSAGIPRIINPELSSSQTNINQLKCLIIELYATFYNPHKLLTSVGLVLECRNKIRVGIEEIGKMLVTGFYHMGKSTIKVQDLKEMILEEMDHIQGYGFTSFENASFYGLVLEIQQLYGLDSIVSAILIVFYIFTITGEKQIFAHRLTLAHRISRESNMLKVFGLKNSELSSIGIVNKKNQVVELEKLFEQDYILHASEADPEIYYMFLDKPFKIQYRELLSSLEHECRRIKHIFSFHVASQQNRYHPNVIQRDPAPDTPLIDKLTKEFADKRRSKEVPSDYYYSNPGLKSSVPSTHPDVNLL